MDLLQKPFLEQYLCDSLQQLAIPSQGLIESPVRCNRHTFQIIKWLTFEKSDGSGGGLVSGVLTDGFYNVVAVFDSESVSSYRKRASQRITNKTKLSLITLSRYNIRFKHKNDKSDLYGLETPLKSKVSLTPVLFVREIVDVHPSDANCHTASSEKVLLSPSVRPALLRLEHDLYARFDLFSPDTQNAVPKSDNQVENYHPGWEGFHILRAQDYIIPRDQMAGISEDNWYKRQNREVSAIQQENNDDKRPQTIESSISDKDGTARESASPSNPKEVPSNLQEKRQETQMEPQQLNSPKEREITDEVSEWSSSPPEHSGRGMDLIVASQLEPNFQTQLDCATQGKIRVNESSQSQSQNRCAQVSNYTINSSDLLDENSEEEGEKLISPYSSPPMLASSVSRETCDEEFPGELLSKDVEENTNLESELSSSPECESPSPTVPLDVVVETKQDSPIIIKKEYAELAAPSSENSCQALGDAKSSSLNDQHSLDESLDDTRPILSGKSTRGTNDGKRQLKRVDENTGLENVKRIKVENTEDEELCIGDFTCRLPVKVSSENSQSSASRSPGRSIGIFEAAFRSVLFRSWGNTSEGQN